MFRYHLLHHKCNIIIITADIAQLAFKAKDISLFTALRILNCFSLDDNDAGMAISTL
jgi:hypothetical protein